MQEKALELLPEVQRRQAMAEGTVNDNPFNSQDVQMPFESDLTNMLPSPVGISSSSSAKEPIVLQKSIRSFPPRNSSPDALTNFTTGIGNASRKFEKGQKTASFLQHRLLSSLGSPAPRMNSLVDGTSLSNFYDGNRSPSDVTTSEYAGQSDGQQEVQSVGFSFPSDLQMGSRKMPLSKLKGKGSQKPHTKNALELNSLAEHSESSYRIIAESHTDFMDISHSNGSPEDPNRSRAPKKSPDLPSRHWNGVFPVEATRNSQR